MFLQDTLEFIWPERCKFLSQKKYFEILTIRTGKINHNGQIWILSPRFKYFLMEYEMISQHTSTKRNELICVDTDTAAILNWSYNLCNSFNEDSSQVTECKDIN